MPDVTRLIGHDLKWALAGAWRASDNLLRQLSAGAPGHVDVAELRRALAEADAVAEVLLNRAASDKAGGGHTVDVDALVTWMEPSIRRALDSRITLSVRPSGDAAFVAATCDAIETILRSLIECASLAMPDGGELTITAGRLDHVSGEWAGGRFESRPYVRVTVGDNGPGDYAETSRRVMASPSAAGSLTAADECVAAMVGRLSGHVIVECVAGEGSRVHVCVPAADAAAGD